MNTISDYLHKKASANAVPLSGCFELSPVCNFRCKMCYVRKTNEQICKEGKKLIDRPTWISLAKQCREAGTLYLLLTGGEPFLYPEFKELYRQLHEMGFLLSANTNASMIDGETIKWLKNYAPTRMNVTLYGASAETYGRICGNPDGYERAMRGIRLLLDAGIPVVLNASMIPENAADIEEIVRIGKDLGVNTRISTYMFPPIRRDKEETDSRFTPEVSARMFIRKSRCQFSRQTLCDMFKKQTERSADDWGVQLDHIRCRAGRSSFWVSWTGEMAACGLLDFPGVQRPFEEPFLDCWKRLTHDVRSMTVLSQCRECELREICNPCAATVYAECGDVNGKPEYLCRMAECIKEEMTAYLMEEQHD